MKKIILIIFLSILSVCAHSDPSIIAIRGSGSFEYPAEAIRIEFSVYNQTDRDVKTAKSKVESASTAIVTSLINLGVSEKDIFSPSFTVDLEDQYDGENCPKANVPVVGRDMEVLLRDVKLYRKVIDALVENGATTIGRVQSEVEDIERYERRATLAAIADAKNQAKFLVENFGGKLGKVHSIGEKRIRNKPYIEEVIVSGIRSSVKDEIPYDFQPEPVEVAANIYVEFEIE
ncbi:SIMPL domain-containing protein [Teredinibacter turnerae]|uniref:SIMPL domain-containing protein n=1 Tax=Teredinibacter turnerae TaxID=2426 RepID=UPI00048AFF60|nr:SIMPL domain-containing protein [Teredinibacter turnerae]